MICTFCGNQYDDSLVSCPFCGTASASNLKNTVPCPKCSSPVMPGQPMCQQCGLINPTQNNSSANATMPNVGETSSAQTSSSVRIESDYQSNQSAPYSQAPYGQNQYNQYNQPQYNQYNQTQYGQYGQNQYPYTQNTTPPYMQNPYQNFANPNDPMYIQESKKVKTQATVALVFAFLIPLVTYILVGLASSRAKKIGYTGSQGMITAALVIAIINHVLAIIIY